MACLSGVTRPLPVYAVYRIGFAVYPSVWLYDGIGRNHPARFAGHLVGT
ncbi:hypothetical protein [uncultured Sulfitobacter sp.]|nr:hypothetical protein [uncultured Sulfitobacter sp.]